MMSAVNILDNMPEIDVNIIPVFLFLKLSGFIGNVLDQPKPSIAKLASPRMSKCFTGLKDTLPLILGLGSPHFTATKAFVKLCKVKTNIQAITLIGNKAILGISNAD